MTNKEIARQFRTLGDLLDLLEENPFKVRSYRNAYNNLRKLDRELASMSQKEIEEIPGVGKAISSKISELLETGTIGAIEKARKNVPPGVEELLKIKGLGPGKIRKLWQGLEIQSPGELLYACEENRLVSLSGFGEKSQSDIRSKAEYYLSQKGLFLYGELREVAEAIKSGIEEKFPAEKVEFAGSIRRKMPTLDGIDLLATGSADQWSQIQLPEADLEKSSEELLQWNTLNNIPLRLYLCSPGQFGQRLAELTGPESFTGDYLGMGQHEKNGDFESERKYFSASNKSYIKPEHRDWENPIKSTEINEDDLITLEDIVGVVHAHSHYSDGLNSLEDMCRAALQKGFKYLAITDHSAFAAYAGGMREEEVLKQWEEIDKLNGELSGFRVIKGIEADILPNGDMDYDPELLKGFELVIASVHSVLKMDEKRATTRLIKAIENPSTHMLGHPTGRLLLSRPGYPLDMEKILDACAQNKVAIELNSNPYRLDLDWKWILPAAEKGIKFSINPDAHSIDGIDDIRHGIPIARKGGMIKQDCLNARNAESFLSFFRK